MPGGSLCHHWQDPSKHLGGGARTGGSVCLIYETVGKVQLFPISFLGAMMVKFKTMSKGTATGDCLHNPGKDTIRILTAMKIIMKICVPLVSFGSLAGNMSVFQSNPFTTSMSSPPYFSRGVFLAWITKGWTGRCLWVDTIEPSVGCQSF